MRATVSFEVDVSKVEETMAVLARQQSHTLRLVTNILDNVDGPTLLEEVTESLDLLHDATSQLQQYRQMLVGFEKARFETILPQEADTHTLLQTMGEVKNATQVLRKFDHFLNKIGEEEADGNADEEG